MADDIRMTVFLAQYGQMDCSANESNQWARNIYAYENDLFLYVMDKGVVVFLDNILIYSTTAEEQFKLLEKVFTHLLRHAFYWKMKKCSFLQKTTTFIGSEITQEGLKISDTKV